MSQVLCTEYSIAQKVQYTNLCYTTSRVYDHKATHRGEIQIHGNVFRVERPWGDNRWGLHGHKATNRDDKITPLEIN